MELIQMMQNRRSVRKYTGEPVGEEALKKVVQAGLLSESGKGLSATTISISSPAPCSPARRCCC